MRSSRVEEIVTWIKYWMRIFHAMNKNKYYKLMMEFLGTFEALHPFAKKHVLKALTIVGENSRTGSAQPLDLMMERVI